MPLYRTVSDRGLWKKYQRSEQVAQPQHFHKPHYLDKTKPVVTYSQLDLGENYRSYNNRQSNPNIPVQNTGNCTATGGDSSKRDWQRRHSESHVPHKTWASTKSAPATPRANSPTRSRKSTTGITSNGHNPYAGTMSTMYHQYNQERRDDDLPPPPPSSTSYAYSAMSSRPTTATSQYSYTANVANYLQDIGGGQHYLRSPHEDQMTDDRTSLESRSLAGYSQMSSVGRGRESSTLGDYNYAGPVGVGYPYQHEDKGHYRRNAYPVPDSIPSDIDPTTPTNNPFVQGSQLQQEADNVVQMFLMNEANKKSIRQGIMQDQTDFVESITKRHLQPGKVEDLPSPTGPYGEMQFEPPGNGAPHMRHQSDLDTGLPATIPVSTVSTRDVISNLRKQFLEPSTTTFGTPDNKATEVKKRNKYLKSENRWQGPPKNTPPRNGIEHNGEIDVPINVDMVQKFQAPEMHHAELVTLRQDENSSSDSDSVKGGIITGDGSDSQTAGEAPSHIILQSALSPMPSSITKFSKGNTDQEVPQLEQHNFELPDPSFPPPPPPEELLDEHTEDTWRGYNDHAFENYKSLTHKEEDEQGYFEPDDQRYTARSKKKGGNFFSSLFKKSSGGRGSQRKGHKGKGDSRKGRPQSEHLPPSTTDSYGNNATYDETGQYPTSYNELAFTKSKSQDFPAAPTQTLIQPVVPQPVHGLTPTTQPVYANQDVFGNCNYSGGYNNALHNNEAFTDEVQGSELGQEGTDSRPPLQRKLSMSKPTDLDEILKLQEQEDEQYETQDRNNKIVCREEEYKKETMAMGTDNASDVFRNDPWFQNRPTTKTPSPMVPAREPSQHMTDIIAEYNHSNKQPIYQNTADLNLQTLTQQFKTPSPKFVPSHDATQEIDIDAILGYVGEDEENEFSQDMQFGTGNYEGTAEIDHIEWPKGSNEAISPNPNNQKGERIEIDYDPLANFQQNKRKKKGGNFFSFGGGNKKNQRRDKKSKEDNTFIIPVERVVNSEQNENETETAEEKVNNYSDKYNNDVPIEEAVHSSTPHSRETSPENKEKYLSKKKSGGSSGLGFFRSSKKKTSTFVETIKTVSSEDHKKVEEKTTIKSSSTWQDNDLHQPENGACENQPSRSVSAGSTKAVTEAPLPPEQLRKIQKSPTPRQKPKGGLKGFFRNPGIKSNKPKSSFGGGSAAPVDVSHLVDEDMDDNFVEPPLATSQTVEGFEETNNINYNEQSMSEELANVQGEEHIDMRYDTTSKVDTDNKASEPTILSAESCVNSDIDTVYPKSIATEFDSTDVGELPNSEPKNNDDEKCSDSSCSSYAGKISKKAAGTAGKEDATKLADSNHTELTDEVFVQPTTSGILKDEREPETLPSELEHSITSSLPVVERREPIEMPAPEEMNVAIDEPRGRRRERKKSEGSGLKGLFSMKPPSRPTSRSRKDAPSQQPNDSRRSRSLPRRRDEGTKGLSGLFGTNRELKKRRQASVERIGNSNISLDRQGNVNQNVIVSGEEQKPYGGTSGEQRPYHDMSRRSSASSQKQPKRQTSGLSGLFSMQPKLPTKRPPSMTKLPMQKPEERQSELPLATQNLNTMPVNNNSRGHRGESKGLSGLFGSSQRRQSGRKGELGMRRSTTFPISRPLEAPPQPPHSNLSETADERSMQLRDSQVPNDKTLTTSEPKNDENTKRQNDLMTALYSSPNRDNEVKNVPQAASINEQYVANLKSNDVKRAIENESANIEDADRIDVIETEGTNEHVCSVEPTDSQYPLPSQATTNQIANTFGGSSNHNVYNHIAQQDLTDNSVDVQPKRQMGRRSGRFRKQTGELNNTTSLTNTTISSHNNTLDQSSQHQDISKRSKTPTEQSMMRDMFAENVSRPSSRPASAAVSRHNSMSSINQADVAIANNLQRQNEKGAPKGSSFKSPRKSASSLGRTESYKQARGEIGLQYAENGSDEYENATHNLGTRAGKDRNKKYNSLPRLSNRKRGDQMETGKFGGNNRPANTSRPNSRGGTKGEEPCKVM